MKMADVEKMTCAQSKAHIGNIVYEAALFLEKLENAGLCYGNGHHAAQHVAAVAAGEVENRWINK